MPRYEVLTPLSNGKKKPLKVGSTVTMDAEDAAYLLAQKALRLVAGSAEDTATDVDVDENERVGFLEAADRMRAELAKLTHKRLDEIIAAERVSEISSSGNKPTVAEKVEAIVAQRFAMIIASLDRAMLLETAASEGYADLAALKLADGASDDEIRERLIELVIKAD